MRQIPTEDQNHVLVGTTERQASRQPLDIAAGVALHLVRPLGILGSTEKMTAKVVEELICDFNKPISEEEIVGIAKLMRLDGGALWIAAGMHEPHGAGSEAAGFPC